MEDANAVIEPAATMTPKTLRRKKPVPPSQVADVTPRRSTRPKAAKKEEKHDRRDLRRILVLGTFCSLAHALE